MSATWFCVKKSRERILLEVFYAQMNIVALFFVYFWLWKKKIIKYKTLLWKMYSTPPPTLLWNVELLNDSAKTASCAPQDKQILYPQKSFENTVAQQPYWPIFKNFFLEYFTAFMTSSQYIRIHMYFLYFKGDILSWFCLVNYWTSSIKQFKKGAKKRVPKAFNVPLVSHFLAS